MIITRFLAALLLSVAVLVPSAFAHEPKPQGMLVIGHRGSPGIGAENTIAGFRHAIELGADGIELDLILTADHKLVVFHDWELNRLIGESQLKQRFPDRSTIEEGKQIWRTRDFTLEELKTLSVIQQGPCATDHPDAFADPTRRVCSYEDAIKAFQQLRDAHPDIVLYTEIKTSSQHMDRNEIDLVAKRVSDTLAEAGELDQPDSHWLQSFDGRVMDLLASDESLEAFRKCQLLSCEPGLIASANPVILDVDVIKTPDDLRQFLEENAAGRGMQLVHGWKLMWWHLLTERDIDCAAIAHDLDLEIHAFTFRDHKYTSDYANKPILAPTGSSFTTAADEIQFFKRHGFDAITSDCIESAVQ